MKVSALLLSSAMLVALSAPALAGEVRNGNMYAKLSGGAIIPEDIDADAGGTTGTLTFDTGWTVSGAFGTNLNQWLSIEAEIGYLDADMDKIKVGGGEASVDGNFNSVLGLVNVNLHPMTGSFDPYIGAGVGFASSEIKIDSVGGFPINASDSSTDLAAQGTVGLNFAVSDSISLGGQYRYIWTDTGGDGADAFTAHSLTAHVTFNF